MTHHPMHPSMLTPKSRRQFLKSALGTAATVFTAPQIIRAETLGNAAKAAANSRIGMGFIGLGKIADGHLRSFPGMKNVQPIAVCDVRDRFVERALARFKSRDLDGVIGTSKFEEVIAHPDVNAVCISTPDHWHAAMAVAAMKAGKDVYVEKPMTLTIEESKMVLAAQKKYGRVLQVGSQQRSMTRYFMATNLVRNGMIGEVKDIEVQLREFPFPPENERIGPVPPGFDYDRWLGPTPFFEFSGNRVKGDYRGGWRCYWEYGNRKAGDMGAHEFDIIQWALGRDDGGPVEFIPKGFEGAKYHHYRYADGITVWRDRNPENGFPLRFIGTEGEVMVSRGKIATSPAELVRHKFAPEEIKIIQSGNHRANFLKCMETREDPIASASVGKRTLQICALSAIAERTGRAIQWNPETEQIVGDADAQAMQDRPRRPGYEMPAI